MAKMIAFSPHKERNIFSNKNQLYDGEFLHNGSKRHLGIFTHQNCSNYNSNLILQREKITCRALHDVSK